MYILPRKADYLRGGTFEPVPLEMMTSRPLLGLLYEVTAEQPARQVIVEDLPFKNSATASGCVPLTYKGTGLVLPPMFSSITQLHNTCPQN